MAAHQSPRPACGRAVRGKCSCTLNLSGIRSKRFSVVLRGLVPGIQCAEHARQLGGASPLSSLMERRISEAQGRRREAGSEGSVEQNRDPMDKNRITRLVRPDERAGNREVHTIKDLSSRFGGCAAKAVELTSGDLRRVSQSGLAGSREPVIAWQKSAEGIVAGRTRRRPERWKGA